MNVAVRSSGAVAIGPASPTASGTSARPAAYSTRRTAAVATWRSTLPHTIVIARTSSAGSVRAHHSATASSTPPSVSMTTGLGVKRDQASRFSVPATGPSQDHGKLIHFSVCFHTYSGVMTDHGLWYSTAHRA